MVHFRFQRAIKLQEANVSAAAVAVAVREGIVRALIGARGGEGQSTAMAVRNVQRLKRVRQRLPGKRVGREGRP